MKKILLFLSLAVMSFCMTPAKAQALPENEDSLLLTIACMSDLHSEYSMIQTSAASKVRLRGTIKTTLKGIKEQEKIDLLLLGGDYTSQVTAGTADNSPSKRYWAAAHDLLVEATRGAFPEGKWTPVLYAAGNHEYDAANYQKRPKTYNSANYYDAEKAEFSSMKYPGPMKYDVGELTPEECFYEDADNLTKGTMSLLAAYHYEVYGFDFVVLNTGKYLFESNENYYYSVESAQWVLDKIASLYEEDPDKTVFFIAHIPFGDSNSISAANKGQNTTKPAADLLKKGLAKFPNLIMLYGHDHGTNSAFIREKTSQRVTRYDVDGNKISSFDDSHVDGTEYGKQDTPEPQPQEQTAYYLKTVVDGAAKYLAVVPTSNSNIGLADAAGKQPVTVTQNGDLLTTTIAYNGSSYYLSAGTGFNFKSGNAGSGEQNSGYWFEIEDPAAETLAATKVAEPEIGKYYIIIQNYQGYMALSNSMKNTDGNGKWRLEGIKVSDMSASKASLSLAAADFGKCVYQYVEEALAGQEEKPQEGETYTYYMKGYANGKYLGWDGSKIAMLDAAGRQEALIVKEDGEDRFSTTVMVNGTKYNMSVGADFGYNFKTDAVYGGEQGHGYWFEIEDPTAETLTAHKVSELKNNACYFIVHQYSSEGYSALGTAVVDMTGAGKYRIKGTEIKEFSASTTTLTLSAADFKNCIYQYEAVAQSAGDDDDDDSGDVTGAEPSFVSSFMGSMRYYNNDIEGGWQPANYEKDAKIIQALMIYVYNNRIEFHMKNYGQSGKMTSSITVNKDLIPYTIFREIHRNKGYDPTQVFTIEKEREQNHKMFNVYGTPVDETYHGIVIMDGKKYFQ